MIVDVCEWLCAFLSEAIDQGWVWLIVDVVGVTAVDPAGLAKLTQPARRVWEAGGSLSMAGAPAGLAEELAHAGVTALIPAVPRWQPRFASAFPPLSPGELTRTGRTAATLDNISEKESAMRTQSEETQHSNPFSGLLDTVTDMNRAWDRMHGTGSGTQTQPRSHVDAWTPTADILAVDNTLVIRADLPGVARDDVEVTYSAPTVTIAGQRRLTEGEQQATYHTKERSWGRFRRTITLPEGIGHEDIDVDLTGGVLEITVHGYSQAPGPAQLNIGDGGSRTT